MAITPAATDEVAHATAVSFLSPKVWRIDVAHDRDRTGVLEHVHTSLATLAAGAVWTCSPRARLLRDYLSDSLWPSLMFVGC